MAVCWVVLRGQQIHTVIQAVHSLFYIETKYNFFSVVTWTDIIQYLQKCEGCTHFCEILYIFRLTHNCILSQSTNNTLSVLGLFSFTIYIYYCMHTSICRVTKESVGNCCVVSRKTTAEEKNERNRKHLSIVQRNDNISSIKCLQPAHWHTEKHIRWWSRKIYSQAHENTYMYMQSYEKTHLGTGVHTHAHIMVSFGCQARTNWQQIEINLFLFHMKCTLWFTEFLWTKWVMGPTESRSYQPHN